MNTNPFYEPVNIGVYDISPAQVDKVLTFETVSGTFAAAPKVVISTALGVKVKEYTVGAGLTRSDNSITLTMQGSDFTNLEGSTLKGEAALFVPSDAEIIFSLEIIKSNL